MAGPRELEVSLRVTHPYVDPAVITAELGMEPDVVHRTGDPRVAPKGTQLQGVHSQSYWSCRVQMDATRLPEIIARTNAQLLKKAAFLEKLTETGGKLEYFVGWYPSPHAGETLDWALLEQCGRLRVNLAFDVYGGK